MREDAELADILSLIDVDSEIPLEAFAAVAEILAYVYRANANMPSLARGAAPTEEPAPCAQAFINPVVVCASRHRRQQTRAARPRPPHPAMSSIMEFFGETWFLNRKAVTITLVRSY